MQLKLRLTLRSDYHTGSGAGIGSLVDSALLRDRDDVPVVRGSTLAGLLREGLRQLLRTTPALSKLSGSHPAEEAGDEGAASGYCAGADVCPLCRVFGSPAAPKRWRVSSARPAGAGRHLAPRVGVEWSAGRSGTHVAARVRISPRDRRALPRHLFKQEEGDRRLQFDFTVACDDDDEVARDEAALIFAAARMVRRFGSARRRGRGECFILALDERGEPDDEAAGHWLGRFRRAWLNGEHAARNSHEHVWTTPTQGEGEPVRVRVILRADEPLVAARRAAAGNVFDCLDHVSASTFWGALANRAAARWGLRAREDGRDARSYELNFHESGAYRAFVNLLLRGAVRVTPLYPALLEPGGGADLLYPTIPTPLDVLTCKAYPGFRHPNAPVDAHGARGFAAADEIPESCGAPVGDHATCPMPLERLGGFVPLRSYPKRGEGASRRDELHPRINPRTQRVATGDLFGYEALDGGQFYVGEIWCRTQTTWEALGELAALPAPGGVLQLRLGKATRRGYGAVTAWFESGASAVEAWRGNLPLERRVADAGAPLTLTLLTPAILPDVWGRFHQGFRRDEATRKLLSEIVGEPFEIADLKLAFAESVFVDTFNNHLGLPRWRDLALRVGSSVGFTFAPGADLAALQARLKEIEAEGVGLRRHEGFGQVVFNHPLYVEGGAGMSDTALTVPDALRLARRAETGTAAAAVRDEEIALDRWLKDLHGGGGLDAGLFTRDGEKGRERWAAVARWLHGVAGEPTERLVAQLDHFGKPDLLVNVSRDEPGDKENYFAAKGPQDTLARLRQWLKRANDRAPSDEARRRMIEELADFMARAARKEKIR